MKFIPFSAFTATSTAQPDCVKIPLYTIPNAPIQRV